MVMVVVVLLPCSDDNNSNNNSNSYSIVQDDKMKLSRILYTNTVICIPVKFFTALTFLVV